MNDFTMLWIVTVVSAVVVLYCSGGRCTISGSGNANVIERTCCGNFVAT